MKGKEGKGKSKLRQGKESKGQGLARQGIGKGRKVKAG